METAEAAASDETAAPSEEADESSDFSRNLDAFCERYDVTPREREVLVEAMHGYSMENIGRKLYVSRETVKTHLRRVYGKVGVSGKQELITSIDHFDEN